MDLNAVNSFLLKGIREVIDRNDAGIHALNRD
jgi:hypothetical protein